jgi:hypothetical protein
MDLRQQVFRFPEVIGDIGFHGGRDAQALVDAAEVVLTEMQTISSPESVPLLTEGIRQAGETANGIRMARF